MSKRNKKNEKMVIKVNIDEKVLADEFKKMEKN